MDMKDHILAALREVLDDWQALLSGMSESQVNAPLVPSDWSTKDVMAHLWAWQQRSIARVEAALRDREPEFPVWPAGLDPESDADTEAVNDWIYQANRPLPWSRVYQNWSGGFQRFLELSGAVSERDLLDSSKYTWLGGYPLALILIASYDHHREHLDKLQAWIETHHQ
ncbi:MAG: ClbS/DfsB family four-helix bundle protein [Rudaea sp.]